MRILLSNDDGYLAEGINVLAAALRSLGELTVVAPERNRSGASSSLTLDRPIRAHNVTETLIRVDGTPTDCVHLAITGLLHEPPDMVVSGINHGANLGDDVVYSGTVAAAIEGRFLGYPAVAVSLVGHDGKHFETAARVTVQILQQLWRSPLPPNTILNVNVPDLPYDEIKGFSATRLGSRHKSEPVIQAKDPRGQTIYWIGPAGPEQDAGPGTDFFAVKNGYVSVTPLMVDLTRHNLVSDVGDWLKEFSL